MSRKGTLRSCSSSIWKAIHSASSRADFAWWQRTLSPSGSMGIRSFLIRARFLSMRELAAARIWGVER